MNTQKSIIIEAIICAVVMVITVGVSIYGLREYRKESKEIANNICDAVCNNEQVVSCDVVDHSLKIVCVSPETKVARIVKIKR